MASLVKIGGRLRSVERSTRFVWQTDTLTDRHTNIMQITTLPSGKIFVKIRSVCPEIWAKLWKNALSHSVEATFQKFLDPDTDVDDFHNSFYSCLSADKSVTESCSVVLWSRLKGHTHWPVLVPVAGASQLAPVNWRVCHATGTRISLVPVTGTSRF